MQLVHTAMWGRGEYVKKQQELIDNLAILEPVPQEKKDQEILDNWEFIKLSAKKRK